MSDESRCLVRAARAPVEPHASWDSPSWRDVPALTIGHHMGESPAHRPLAQVKLQYDAEFVHLAFRVEDRYVRAVAAEYQGEVWKDSCVEFFFTPGTDLGQGYFNLEASCGGVILFTHRMDRTTRVVPVSEAHARELDVAHTLPSRVEPERMEPTTWEVGYRVPWKMLQAYAPVVPPRPARCGGRTSTSAPTRAPIPTG